MKKLSRLSGLKTFFCTFFTYITWRLFFALKMSLHFQTNKSLSQNKKEIQSKLDVNEKDLAAAHLLISQVCNLLLLDCFLPFLLYPQSFLCFLIDKGKSHIRSVRWEVPVRKDTCPGPSALWRSVANSFPRRLYLPSVSAGSPFAAGWTVRERPTIGSRWVPNRGLRHSRPGNWATNIRRPLFLVGYVLLNVAW